MSGFNWGLTPSGKEPSEPEKPEVPEPKQPETKQPETTALPIADEDDPFSIFTPKPVEPKPVEPKPVQSKPLQPKPTPTVEPKNSPANRPADSPTQSPDTDELPATEAMPTSREPYRPAPVGPVEPPAEPFAFTPLPNAALQRLPPAKPPIEPPAAATTVLPGAGSPATSATSAGIDDVFGEAAFQDYTDAPLIAPLPQRRDPNAPRPPRATLTSNQRLLIGVAGGLVAALVLLLVFVLGTHLPGLVPSASPVATSVSTPRPTQTASAPATGPVSAGVHAWNALRGGECLDPFDTAWATEFTVVDCTSAHAAQLVAKGTFDEASFPGAAKLAAAAKKACVSSKVIDYEKAKAYDDLSLSTSYATTQADWDAGNTSYYCFVSGSAQELTGSLAQAS